MHKLGGNRTLAHSGGNALDRAVTHVAGYLLARLAHLIVPTDVAGSSLESGNGGMLEEEIFGPVFFEFPLIALKECYHAFRYLQSILMAWL